MTPAASVAVHWAENVLPPMIFACASCFFARFEAALQFLSGGALRFLGTDVGGREDDRIDAGDRRAQVRWHVLARWIRIGQADGRHHFLGIGLGVALKSEGAIARHNELFVVLDDESGPVDTIVVFDFAVIQWHFQAESSTARRVQKTRRIPRVERSPRIDHAFKIFGHLNGDVH